MTLRLSHMLFWLSEPGSPPEVFLRADGTQWGRILSLPWPSRKFLDVSSQSIISPLHSRSLLSELSATPEHTPAVQASNQCPLVFLPCSDSCLHWPGCGFHHQMSACGGPCKHLSPDDHQLQWVWPGMIWYCVCSRSPFSSVLPKKGERHFRFQKWNRRWKGKRKQSSKQKSSQFHLAVQKAKKQRFDKSQSWRLSAG